jgi:hypothetical protein
MNPIFLLKEIDLLEGNKTMLNIGAKDGRTASRFVGLDFEVDVIDINEPTANTEGVNFEKISVEDFY